MKRTSPGRHTTPVDHNEKAYRALVESTPPTLPSRGASLEEIYSHFGLSHDGALNQQHVIEVAPVNQPPPSARPPAEPRVGPRSPQAARPR